MTESSAGQNGTRPKPGILGGMLLRLLIIRLFLPTFFLMIMALLLAGYTSHRMLDSQQMELSRVLAHTVDTFLHNAKNMLRSSANMAEGSQSGQLSFYLRSAREGFGYFDAIYRLDSSGVIVEMEPREPRYISLDQSRQPFFTSANAQIGLHISKPFNSMRTGKPTVNITWPLGDGGMMVAELNLGRFQDAVAAAHHEHSRSTIIIMDRAGTFLAHPRSELIAQQARMGNLNVLQQKGAREGTMHFREQKQWMVGSYAQVKTTGWLVLVQAPIAVVYGNLLKVAVPLFLFCLGIWTFVALTFRKRFFRYVVNPLTDLSNTAIAISSGDLERTAAVEQEDEIGIVAMAFNSMTAQLRDVIGRLKERVEQLTHTREELKTHQEKLEGLVETRTAALTERTQQLEAQAMELSAAKQQADTANAAKSDFLARMSHEIRTPLNAITGLTLIVLKSGLSAEQRDYLNKVQIASNNLLAIINDILDFSKVEAGRMELEHHAFNLDEVMEQLADLFSDRVAQADLELIMAINPLVPNRLVGDAGRLSQVLTNLVANAIKFTPKGEIIIAVDPDKDAQPQSGKATLKFRVSDTGTGISTEVLPTLFEPFIQADSSLTREHKGTGLGLAICSRLIELMGGKIWAHSTPGKGSTFFFTLAVEGQPEKQPRFSLPSDLHGLKALVADDSSTARKVMGNLLASFSFEVSIVENGKQAVEELKRAKDSEPYQLVLLDWKMPEMDGIETARCIRDIGKGDSRSSDLKFEAPIIILVTAFGQILIKDRIDTQLVDSVMLKPVKPSQLFNTIMELFGKKTPGMIQIKKDYAHLSALVGRRVLVVEDSEMNRDVVVALLENAGLIVDTAENGKVAVEKVIGSPERHYDGVLMDIQMPVMEGYEATKKIRELETQWDSASEPTEGASQHPKTTIPIIAVTAHALKGEKEKCLAAGMDDYIAKPIDEKLLNRVLSKWILHQNADLNPGGGSGASQPSDQESVLDSASALKRLGGRKHIYIKVLEKFNLEFGQAYGTITRLLSDNELEAASRLAHSVKGAAGTIGAAELNRVAAKMEKAIDKQGMVHDEMLSLFKLKLEEVVDAVEGMLASEKK